jgi:3-phenylpropionate/cinnamic acid dioxygenase small subunit
MSEIADRLEIMDLLARYGAGLDARDWILWRNVFTDRARFDMSSWSDETPQRVETDRVVRVQARIFAEFDVTQHLMSNFRITLEGDSARVIAVMRAEHWIRVVPDSEATKRYTMFGYYDDRLLRTEGEWKIDEMQLNVTRTEGERWVIQEATRRARAKRTAQ